LILEGQFEKALVQVKATIEHCRHSGDAFPLPELLRLQASIHKAQVPGDNKRPETLLEESLSLSQQQGSRSWALRSAIDLAALWQAQGRGSEAQRLLGQHREQFSEGFDTQDLRLLQARLDDAQRT
jgi:predicted ATPase